MRKSFWNDERNNRLIKLFNRGKTDKEICKKLNVSSKGAIITQRSILGLKRMEQPKQFLENKELAATRRLQVSQQKLKNKNQPYSQNDDNIIKGCLSNCRKARVGLKRAAKALFRDLNSLKNYVSRNKDKFFNKNENRIQTIVENPTIIENPKRNEIAEQKLQQTENEIITLEKKRLLRINYINTDISVVNEHFDTHLKKAKANGYEDVEINYNGGKIKEKVK